MEGMLGKRDKILKEKENEEKSPEKMLLSYNRKDGSKAPR